MTVNTDPVVVFFAFANDRVDQTRYLRNLPEEQRQVRAAIEGAEKAGHCEIVERANATITEILDVFQDPGYRHRIALFHFGGHAGDAELLLESGTGEASVAHAAGLARFLGEQRGLELVFLNGCSSRGQSQGLLDAGVRAVIATSQVIDDAMATEFSVRFYKSLAAGDPIRTAYRQAAAAVETRHGDTPRGATRGNARADERTSNRGSVPLEAVELEADALPWDLYHLPGADEHLGRWSLPLAAGDALFGMPAPPDRDLPAQPFKHLAWFTAADAEVFFGRGREIREIYKAATLADASPIVLLFGGSGVGKSSLLAAGLLPRLESSHQVEYIRRDGALGLAGALSGALGGDGENFGRAWRHREEELGRPLVVILDQVEEAWCRPLAGGQKGQEGADLAAALRQIFAVRETRPQGRLLLTFRKEWLAEVLGLLESARLPRPRRIELKHLGQHGIAEAVAGVASTERLRREYGLQIEPELPQLIADDLLEDPGAAIAPALQILLTKMWQQAIATDSEAPEFSIALYQDLRRRGILLDDFLEEQLAGLREWRPEVVDSGLALDLLAHHTTPLGTAEVRAVDAVVERYGGREGVIELLQSAKDRYLLAGSFRTQEGELLASDTPANPDAESTAERSAAGTSRLAHDTLAQLIRRRFRASDLPGQRASRILQQRAVDWADDREGVPLDEADLEIVEWGERGMPALTDPEERLLAASRRQQRRRRFLRRVSWVTAAVLVTAVMIAGGWAWWFGMLAEEAAQVATAGKLAATALTKFEDQLDLGLLLSAQAAHIAPTYEPRNTLLLGVQSNPQLRSHLRGCAGKISSLAFASDAKTLAAARQDGSVCRWELATSQRQGEPLASHEDFVSGVAFAPDGKTLASADDDGTLRLWDLARGRPMGEPMTGHKGSVLGAAFSPDGRTVASAGIDGTVCLWDMASGRLRGEPLEGHRARVLILATDGEAPYWRLTSDRGPVSSVAFAPDGKTLVSAGEDGMVRLWNPSSGEPIGEPLAGHVGPVLSVAFAPDGRTLASAGEAGTVRLWDLATRQLRGEPLTGHGGEVERMVNAGRGFLRVGSSTLPTRRVLSVAFAPDSKTLASAGEDGTVRLWDVASGQLRGEPLTGHDGTVLRVAFAPDGNTVASADQEGTVLLWDVASGQLNEPLAGHHDGEAWSVAFAPDDLTLASGGADGTVRLWDVTTRQPRDLPLTSLKVGVRSVAFAPDGETLAVGSKFGQVRLWETASGKPRGEPLIVSLGKTVSGITFAADGSTLSSVGVDGTVRVWDLATGQPRIEYLIDERKDGLAGNVAFAPAGATIASPGIDGKVRLWDSATRQPSGEPLLGHRGRVWSVAFAPDGKALASGGEDGTVRLWDLETGQPHGEPLTGHEGRVRSVAFGPEGGTGMSRFETGDSDDRAFGRVVEDLASGGHDGTVRLWDPASGQPIGGPLIGHEGPVNSLAFASNGRTLASAGADGTVRLWDVGNEAWIARACFRANRNLTVAEWSQYVGPDVPYQCTCPELPAGEGETCGP